MAKRKKERSRRAGSGELVVRENRFLAYPPGTLQLEEVDLSATVSSNLYGTRLKNLQEKVYRLQIENYLAKNRAIIVFEGWDAAGKGGCIKRLTALMDPRGLKVWPIAAPRDAEKRNHYLWRFWYRLPEKGEVAIFDRSWYGRVLVERVEGFAKDAEWKRAFDEINAFEKMLTDDGVRIAKFFFHIDRQTQLARFEQRETDPLKKYKLSAEDWRNRKRWNDYTDAIQDMLDRTHRPDAPWTLVPANDKKFARLLVLETCARLLKS
ncbi:MAG TPA: polyphosphate kinase [Anaeromyxobacteraceae bacterium]|nr:polyphosphate kinase [Anaeromyxobacteraceae bacterium]